jgi:crotonobetainyl-CoA:carnitine CoA-transferase CaiB-like acyl-CoA transferase
LLTEADILATDVADYRQVLNSEQARTNGYVMGLEHPTAGKINVTGCPVSHEAASAEQPWNLSFPTPKRHRLFLYVLCHSV